MIAGTKTVILLLAISSLLIVLSSVYAARSSSSQVTSAASVFRVNGGVPGALRSPAFIRSPEELILKLVDGISYDTIGRWEAQQRLYESLDEFPPTQKQSLKKLVIKLRITPCKSLKTSHFQRMVREALAAEDDDYSVGIGAYECAEDDKIPVTPLYLEQEVQPDEPGIIIYRDGQQLHPLIANQTADPIWKRKMRHRYRFTRDFVQSMMDGQRAFEYRPVVEFTIAIPVLPVDLRHTHLPLISILEQTYIPSETVFAINDFDLEKDGPMVKAFTELLAEFFSELPGKTIIVQRKEAWCGLAREMAINVSKLPFFTTFDADDFMHPLWVETMVQLFNHNPGLDAILTKPFLVPDLDTCDLKTNRDQLKSYFEQHDLADLDAVRARQEYALSPGPKQFYEETKKYDSTWFLGNTDAEPRLVSKGKLDWWFPVHNGWQTSRRIVYETVGFPRDKNRGEDVRFNYRAVMAGFEVGVYQEFRPALYAFRQGHSKCLDSDDLLDHEAQD